MAKSPKHIAIVGGGINGLCCAWELARQGHNAELFERGRLMHETSRASSKLLHGGLRYLETLQLRLVREVLAERDQWFERAPQWAHPCPSSFPSTGTENEAAGGSAWVSGSNAGSRARARTATTSGFLPRN